MERDSLLAHGAAYLVHDRLHNCSDYHVMDVCASCGSLLSTMQSKAPKHAQQTLHLSAVEADGKILFTMDIALVHMRTPSRGKDLLILYVAAMP